MDLYLTLKKLCSMEQDLELTDQLMRYGDEGGKTIVTMPAKRLAKRKSSNAAWPIKSDGAPDFASMTADQRLAYHTARLKQ